MTQPAPVLSPLAAPVQGTCELPPHTAIIDGRRLRQLRRQAGLSIDNLAHQSGVGITTLGRLERQDRPHCRVTTLARLGSLLLTQVRYEHPASIKDAEAQELGTREAADMRRADSASAQLIRDRLDGLPADPTGLN
jgi:transcriptional regulator with XRE-family HTH domain